MYSTPNLGLEECFEENKILVQEQNGFRDGRGTTEHNDGFAWLLDRGWAHSPALLTLKRVLTR